MAIDETSIRRQLYCPHCKAPIGHFTDAVLWIGPVTVRHKMSMSCAQCSHQIRWRPTAIDTPKTAS